MVVWLALLAGLVIAVLLASRMFAMPKFGSANRHVCCANQAWTPVADLGEARGVDFDLGRCDACGAWLMAVFYVSSTTYNVISEEQAHRFLALQGTPELKRALRAWFD